MALVVNLHKRLGAKLPVPANLRSRFSLQSTCGCGKMTNIVHVSGTMPPVDHKTVSPETDDELRLVIHAVHGTWPFGIRKQWRLRKDGHSDSLYAGAEIPWFLEQSDFAQSVLKSHPARWLAFKWNGSNSFKARADAISAFREHLTANLQEPHTRHIIIAHSHGGTVAAAAVAPFSELQLRKIEGVITMGAPFITLTDTEESAVKTMKLFVSRFGFAILLVYLFGVFLAWWLGMPNYFGTGLVFSLVGWFALLVVTNKWEFRDPEGGPSRNLFDAYYPMKRPVVALRAPGDEAGLAIGSAQLFSYFGERIWSLTVLVGVGWLIKFFAWMDAARYRVAVVWLCVIALAGIAGWYFADIAHMGPIYFRDWRDPAIVGVFALAGMLLLLVSYALLVMLVAILATVLTLWPGIMLLRFATGWEAGRFAGLFEIECEPVPSGMRAIVETLRLEAGERAELAQRQALRHSFHELSAARRRVAELIDAWVTPRGDPVLDVREGGRVCDLLFQIWEMEYRDRLAVGGPEAVATFRELHDIVMRAGNELSEANFKDRFVRLLPSSEQSDAELILTRGVVENLQRHVEFLRRPLGSRTTPTERSGI